tara:strand:- start:192 stop:599 length:408 start_codon:yes stop_codon:yes gene_type:complete
MCNPKIEIEIDEIKPKRLPSLKKAQIKYYEKNKNKILEYSRNYNKDYGSKKFSCECGTIISTYGKFAHLKSNKHIKNMKIKNAKENGTYTEEMDKSNCNKKINCPCGGLYLKRNMKTHINSKKHINFIKQSNDEV